MNPKLIIVRGPSASGKSTVARMLAQKSTRKIAVLEEDYFRRTILQSRDETRAACKQMLLSNSLAALAHGYDVILEGILNIKHYGPVLDQLFKNHPKNNHLFYFDVSLAETQRRHRYKPIANDVSDQQLAEWYAAASPSGHSFEKIIPQSFSLKQAISFLEREVGFN